MNSKLREALEAIDKNTDLLDISENIAPKLHPSHSFIAVQIRKIVRTALAEPLRNCDIGTADEQYKRHCKWCKKMRDYSCAQSMCRECYAKWSQMPYEEGKKINK